MGHKEDRERLKQSQIERRKIKPGTSRVTRSASRNTSAHDTSANSSGQDNVVQEMRSRAKRHFSLQSYATAIFFAEKALALSQAPDDVLYLARIYHADGQHNRALHLITSRKLDRTSAVARLLAAQCLYAAGAVMECLELIGEEVDPERDPAISSTGRSASERAKVVELSAAPDIRALLCVMRARVYESLENAPRVVLWYKRALVCDVGCTEAFLRLTQSGLLSAAASSDYTSELAVPSKSSASESRLVVPALYRVYADPTASVSSLPVGIQDSDDVVAVLAMRSFAALDYAECAKLCRGILKRDPSADARVLTTYLAALVELGQRQELFEFAHELVEKRPRSGTTWMAVGYYYLVSGVADTARRYLQKASILDPRLAEAWVAVGHAYAAQDESDQAMSAYTTAARLYPGSHLPPLFMGIQHARQSSLGFACTLFSSAADGDPRDPAPHHELGVIAFRMGDVARAVDYFQAALALWAQNGGDDDGDAVVPIVGKRAEAEEISLVNLGHCFRRLRKFELAKECYESALSLNPCSSSTFISLGLTLHSMEQYELATSMYHRALIYAPEDVICNELLERALDDIAQFSDGEDEGEEEEDSEVFV